MLVTVWLPLSHVAEHWPRALRVDLLFDVVRASAYLDGYGRAVRKDR